MIGNPKLLANFAELLISQNLKVSNINANTAVFLDGLEPGSTSFEPALSNPSKKIRQQRLDFTYQVLDVAQALHADTISITSGLLDPELSRESQLGYFTDSINAIIAQAGNRSIRVGIEAEPGLLIGDTEQAGTLIEQIGSPYLGINWDAGHAVVAGENLPDVIHRYSSHFFNTHIEDIRDRKHYHLIPGEGDIDFKTLFDDLNQSGYDGFYTVELYTYRHAPVKAAKKAFSFLSNMI